ncbi:MAG TPA: chorismate synthase [Sediminispirochaeta sp.]|nr:chorismate synthase [Sediminispirochaeta sp.]
MSGSSFGTHFKISTFGESHGPAIGVVLDGLTPGVPIEEADIQKELDRRKPGQSSITTSRRESDRVHILSGLYQGRTTGTPLAMVLYNQDQDSSAYEHVKEAFRPGHADFTYQKKYGIRDHRGSGRASGRETAARVAAGAVARKILEQRGIQIVAYTQRAAGVSCQEIDYGVIEKNPMRAADLEAARMMVRRIEELKAQGDSAGGLVECRIIGVEPGLGEPVFDKLEAQLGKAILSIGAVRGIEFGAGFSLADMSGSRSNDQIFSTGFDSNRAGGIVGGISNGEEIAFRLVVKPTASISRPQASVNSKGEEIEIQTEGRHDPCICPRIVPVVEAMSAIVILDMIKRQAALQAPQVEYSSGIEDKE